jgi:predicted NBD/HSP70 family sugar kinase
VRDIAANGIPPWLRNALEALAITIAGALNVLGVRRVVITGILNEFPEAVMTHLSQAITAGTLWARFGEVACEARPRKRLAGLVSAAVDRLLLPDVTGHAGRAWPP